MDGFAGRTQTLLVSRFIVAPLNQATGGLASPAFQIGKALISGSSAAIGGAVGAALVFAAQKGIEYYEKRVAENKAEAAAANEKDNSLIKAGTKSYITEYSGSFGGVKATDRK
jgi:hypothetical protein